MTRRTPLNGPDDPRHGTVNGYHNHGCRCDACNAANTEYCLNYQRRRGRQTRDEYVAARKAAALGDNHGTETRYTYGCRCDDCKRAAADARRARRARGLT